MLILLKTSSPAVNPSIIVSAPQPQRLLAKRLLASADSPHLSPPVVARRNAPKKSTGIVLSGLLRLGAQGARAYFVRLTPRNDNPASYLFPLASATADLADSYPATHADTP
jgi:hypothetical protein